MVGPMVENGRATTIEPYTSETLTIIRGSSDFLRR
jgi:hypothetical protein